jgi:mannan endo-1,4-beta-mannosidase
MTTMTRPRLLLASLAATALGCAGSEAEAPLPPPPPAACAPLPPIRSAIGRSGSTLTLEGHPFRALGANLYYLQQMFAYDELGVGGAAEQARAALDAMVCLSMNVVRLWAFNDSKDSSSIRRAPGMYSEQGLRGLDRAVAEAKTRGVRVILPLVNGRNDYGGLRAYAAWADPGAQDEDLVPERFFHEPAVRQYWKDYAALLVGRVNTVTGIAYRDEPAIVAWEIGNELRCRSCAGTTSWRDTIAELVDFLHASGVTQLIADGSDGFDEPTAEYLGLSNGYPVSGVEGTSFSRLLTLDGLDLVSYHGYPELLGLQPGRDMDIWIAAHEDEARRAGKVAYLGEFGYKPPAAGAQDRARALQFGRWLERVYDPPNGSMAGSLALLWQLEPPERRPTYDDGYGVVLELDPLCAGQLYAWASKLLAANSAGGQP